MLLSILLATLLQLLDLLVRANDAMAYLVASLAATSLWCVSLLDWALV